MPATIFSEKKFLIITFFSVILHCFLINTGTLAQNEKGCPEVSDKKAIKLYEQGKNKKKYDKKQRLEFLRQAVELEADYVEALYLLADEQIKTAKFEGTSFNPAEKHLLKVIEVCPEYNPYAYSYLGQISYGSKKYSEAYKYLEKFLKYVGEIKTDADYDFASQMSKKAKAYAEIFENPVPFEPFCVNDVSSGEDEYLAIISPDNERMFFTRRMPVKTIDQPWQSDRLVEVFSYSKREEEKFESGKALTAPFNLGDNYGGATISPDNKHLYVTVCKAGPKNYMNCDIFTSDFINGEWSELKNLGPKVNTEDGWEAQPSISADGRSLYFATARAESKGMDIYKTEKDGNGEWSAAQSLGAKINTDKNEKSPFIHSDSQTLYFSSDGHTGAGGYDIFFVKGDDKGEWQAPKNIGIPINTEQDEVGFFVSTDGRLGYFASNSFKGKCKGKGGGYDIFAFDLYKEARPEEVLLVKGSLKNEKGEVEKDAKIEIKNTLTKKITQVEVDSVDGEYVAIVAIKQKEDVVLTVKKEGMAFSSKLISSKESTIGKLQQVNMELKAIEIGAAYRLNNINYATNSADLTSESLYILDEFITFLNEIPSVKIAIHGHTDDVGADANNLALSTDRAFSVLQYLQEKGIDKGRLSFKGFGETSPLVSNISEENRAKNRRTEFVILSK